MPELLRETGRGRGDERAHQDPQVRPDRAEAYPTSSSSADAATSEEESEASAHLPRASAGGELMGAFDRLFRTWKRTVTESGVVREVRWRSQFRTAREKAARKRKHARRMG